MRTGELRYLEGAELVEYKPEGRSIFGYGAVFDKPSQVLYSREVGDFIETIDKRAFDSVLKDPYIMVLANHDKNMVLGRTGAGTAKVGVDERGFWYDVTDPPASRADIVESIQRRDVFGSSFGFEIEEEDWSRGSKSALPERRLYKFRKVFDLGPVSYPAYMDTSAAARSYRSYMDSVRENDGLSNLLKYKIKLFENSIII